MDYCLIYFNIVFGSTVSKIFQDFPRFSDESLNEIENWESEKPLNPRHSLEVCRAWSPCTRKQTSMCQYLQERGGYPQWTCGRNGMQKSSSPCVGLRLDYILEDVCDPILRKLSVFQPSPEYQVAHEASWHPWSPLACWTITNFFDDLSRLHG